MCVSYTSWQTQILQAIIIVDANLPIFVFILTTNVCMQRE